MSVAISFKKFQLTRIQSIFSFILKFNSKQPDLMFLTSSNTSQDILVCIIMANLFLTMYWTEIEINLLR